MSKEMNMLNHCATSINVTKHIITSHGWEYYLTEPSEDYPSNIRFGLVMGFETELGMVDTDEIAPFAISSTDVNESSELMPAEGWEWS